LDSQAAEKDSELVSSSRSRKLQVLCYTVAFSEKSRVVMAEKKPQNFANHARLDPLFHFFTLPVFLGAVVAAVVHFIGHPGWHSATLFVVSVAALIAVFKIRLYTLRVQDRVIRLEERLRMSVLLPEPLRSRIAELTEDQLIALRFASDVELPKLAERALNEKLSRADIKKAIQVWRPDYWRI
jgi:hypothetical protein